jgi:para-nitrobenzyl esterase
MWFSSRAMGKLRRQAIRLIGSQLLACAMIPAPSFAQENQISRQAEVVVDTAEGPVRGREKDGIDMFLGIPYASPPVGKYRWRPPQPVEHWTKPIDATHYAGTCPQVATLGTFAGPPSVNEDCLYLNVFTTGGRHTGKKKPVIVWIHGGGNVDGESNDYDGSKLVRGGSSGVETVVVTFNYRLNLFGYFSHPAINAGQPMWGNYGTLDQQAVLHWVQRNIESFGGDPTKVTVGGQSAGSYDTGANILSPLSKGLFSRAIFMSSPGFTYIYPTADEVIKKGMDFAAAVGCPGTDANTAQCLRNLPTARILQFAGTLASFSPYDTIIPFVDGTIIPMQPEEAWNVGAFNKMPIMGGSTQDEYTFFTGLTEYYTGWPQRPMNAADYKTAVSPGAFCLWCKNFKMPDDVRNEYVLEKFNNDAMMAFQRLNTDIAKCRELHVLRKWAPQVPVYAYDFTYANAPFYFPKMPGLDVGAAHTIDIQFLFDGYHGGPLGVNLDQSSGQPRGLNAAESRLSDEMVAAWVRFADTGNPNGPGTPLWPTFTTGPAATFLVENMPMSTKGVSQFRDEYQCDYWDERLPLRN